MEAPEPSVDVMVVSGRTWPLSLPDSSLPFIDIKINNIHLIASQRSSRVSRAKNFVATNDRIGTPQFFQQDELSSSEYDDLIQIDGESFHLILMPAYLPGGAHTLRQMRSALLKIFQTARECEEERKNSSTTVSGYNSERQDELLHALNSMENRTASLL